MKFLRYSLGLLDQGVLSVASLLFLIVGAQFLGTEDLGDFVLGLSTAVLVQSLTRALSGETLLVRSTQAGFQPCEIRAAVGLSLIIAVAGGLAFVLLALFVTDKSMFFMSLAAALVGLLTQDATRFSALAMGSTSRLLVVDATYSAVSILSLYWAGAANQGSVGMLTALGGSACGVGVVAMVWFRIRPKFRAGIGWAMSYWRLNSSFLVEAALGALLGYTIALVLVFFVNGGELAAYRSTLSIFGLTSLAINFLRTIVLRDLRQDSLKTRMMFWKTAGIMSLLVGVTVGVTYVVLISLPNNVGVVFFGETWLLMATLFAAAALNRVMAGVSIIPTIFLRVQGITWRATSIRIVVTVVGFGLGPVGAWLAGARGALIAEALLYLTLTIALMALSKRLVTKKGPRHLAPVGA